MRLLPPWEKSPFTTKRASEQVADVKVPDESLRRQVRSVPSANFSLSSQKQPIDPSRTIDTNTRQNVTHGLTGGFSSYACNSETMDPLLASTNPPRLDLSFTASPSLLDMLNDSRTMGGSQFSEKHDGKMRGSEPPRQTSNSSSTSRSRRSASSSRQSRPSSRSSFGDQAIPIEAIKVSRFRALEDESLKRYRQNVTGQDAVVVRSSKSLPRPNSLPAVVTLVEGSSREKPMRHVTGLDDIVNGVRSPGSTRIPALDSSKFKRGARLGNLMMEGFSQQAPPPIRSSFVLGDLPAIKSRHGKGEKTEPAKEIRLPQQPARQKESPSDEISGVTEHVLLGILRSLDSTKDLASTAMVNRSFYRVFRLHERDLLNKMLYATSLPAWELRSIMQSEQKRGAFKLRSFQRDVATIRALHAFILMRCQHICRRSTIDALLETDTARKVELDNALWRIWSFCRLFGKNRNHYDVKTQMIWLEGGNRQRKGSKTDMFGVGNGRGLSLQELEDMSEMWRCLKALLEGFKGREADARNAGIFDNCIIDEHGSATEKYFLETWIHELLCLGPKAVLTLNSCSFEQARVLGVTKWTPPTQSQNRGEFFEVAVEEVYRERLVTEARLTANQFEKQMRARPKPTRAASDYSATSTQPLIPAGELRVITNQYQTTRTTSQQASLGTESPSLSSECRSISPVSPASLSNFLTMRPAAFSSLSITTTASAKLGATMFPVQNSSSNQTCLRIGPDQIPSRDEDDFTKPDVLDPVDKAMTYLVRELGFPEVKAKQALAMSDDGQGINIPKAVELLMIGTEARVKEQGPLVAELAGVPIMSPTTSLEREPSMLESQSSASLQNEVTDDLAQVGTRSRRKSFRFGADVNGDSDRDIKRETHIMNTMKAMCDPMPNISSVPTKSWYPHGDAAKDGVQTRMSTSKYTIAGRRHSHRPTLSTGSTNFNPDELRLDSSVYTITPLSVQTGVRKEYLTTVARLENKNNVQNNHPHKKPPKIMTIKKTSTKPEKKLSRNWSIKEAFKKRDEATDETIGCAL